MDASPILPFEREIRFDAVSFRYAETDELVLTDIDLVIPKGTRVALIGPTGSGKSTIIDLLMGLLEPTSGTITVDGVPLRGEARVRWQKRLAHVPQSVFLADDSIERNIAFGTTDADLDRTRVEQVAALAQIDGFVEQLSAKYRTAAGERGARLSGGQRQRLGIARALYKRADMLILDEATSALDENTERAVMRSLEGLTDRLTLVMIAHRLSTITNCNLVVRIEAGRVTRIGSFDEVMTTALENSR